jgi:tetratricopeptide (TPR) repeat protein
MALIAETDAPPEAWLLLGRAFHALGEYGRALAAFREYLRLEPASGQGRFFAGRTCLSMGLPRRAIPFFRQALEQSPQSVRCLAFLGLACLRARASAPALEALRQAVEAAAAQNFPADEQQKIYRSYLNSLIVRGLNLCRREDYDTGAQMLRFALEAGAEGVLIRLALGRACTEQGLLDEALAHYEAAIPLAPDDERLRWYRVSTLMALGRGEEALSDLARLGAAGAGPEAGAGAKALPWDSELVDLFMARSFLEAGEYRRAADTCKARLKRGAQRAGLVHCLYGEALRGAGNAEAARNHLMLALKDDPDNPSFWYALILAAWDCRDWKRLRHAVGAVRALDREGSDAAACFEALVRAHDAPDNRGRIALLQDAIRALGPAPDLMEALADAYSGEGLHALAWGWYRKARVLEPEREGAWAGELAALRACAPGAPPARDAELRASYAAYLAAWPSDEDTRRDYALFLVKTGAYAEAIAELETLLASPRGDRAGLRRVLAYAYRKTGRYREAAVFLKGLLRETPYDEALLVELAGCLERSGSSALAIRLLAAARKQLPQSANLALSLGILHWRARHTEKAFDCLREAAALAPADPRPCEWQARIARQLGETAQARRYAEKAAARKARQVNVVGRGGVGNRE